MRVNQAQVIPFGTAAERRVAPPAMQPLPSPATSKSDRLTFGGYYGQDAILLNGADPATGHPELVKLDGVRGKLEAKAREKGLDFYPVRFHILNREKFLQAAARNGFLERYPHWSWGQEYFQLGFALQHGVNKKRELVQNGNPVPAFLMEMNPSYAQKALMAMAYARSDLYKNNIYFRHTNRRLSEEVSENARVIRGYINDPALGLDRVETFIDKVHSLRNLINQTGAPRAVGKDAPPATWERPERDALAFLLERSESMEPWQKDILTRLRSESYQTVPLTKTQLLSDGWAAFWNRKLNTENPDLLDFENLTSESKWMADVMKLNSVGLNTYKLGAIIFEHLEERFRDEVRAELKAEGIDLPEPLLGSTRMERLEKGLESLLGFLERSMKDGGRTEERLEQMRERIEAYPMSREQQKLLEDRVLAKLKMVRTMENDVSLVRKYLTPEIVEEAFLYTYKPDPKTSPTIPSSGNPAGGFNPWMGRPATPAQKDLQGAGTKLKLSSREFEDVRSQLIKMFENGGQPAIEIVNTNFQGKGELLLRHIHEYDLKKNYAEKTLGNLSQLWGKPVHLLTRLTDEKGDMKPVRMTSDGSGGKVTVVPATEKDRE